MIHDVVVLFLTFFKKVIKAAKGRPVVILNPRMLFMPTETNEYETAYLLKQFTVQPVKTNPKVS